MKLAFYAPMKPPGHPVPSGDRRMARLLMEALRLAGHDPELACRFVSRDSRGDAARQARMIALGGGLAHSLLRRYRVRPPEARPSAWFTYHLYYKAPDLIGPEVARGLGIPYIAAEVSLAGKRASGPWDLYHQALLGALEQASALVTINPADAPALPGGVKQISLPPFLERVPESAPGAREEARKTLARQMDLPYVHVSGNLPVVFPAARRLYG